MKTQETKIRNARLGLTLAAMAGLTAGIAQANPEGWNVIDGVVTFTHQGNTLTIDSGHMSIIEWESFSIGIDEAVIFNMLNEHSRVLNRITGPTPTEIMGSLTSNGQVFIVNPAGVVFGQGAVVNVGALYAAAGNISNNNFRNGTYRFTDLQGSVENHGLIQGDLVAMIGAQVANIGSISSPEGTVIMAAGRQVLIGTHLGNRFVEIEIPAGGFDQDEAFNENSFTAGDIFSIAAWNSGSIVSETVIIKTAGANVENTGTIAASGAGGGSIEITGENVFLSAPVTPTASLGVPITGGTVVINAGIGGVIDLGVNISSTANGIFLNGDVRLTESVSLSSSGILSNTEFNGDVFSEVGEFNTLNVFATDGDVFFGGSVGADPASDMRLGFLDVDARRGIYMDDVSTRDGMTLMGLTEILGPSVTFHTGTGSALFGGDIYSSEVGESSVAFMYDGDVTTGVGEGRTPFKFQGSIGAQPVLRLTPNSGAFKTIHFGGDVSGSMVAASFLFSNAAVEGTDLMDVSAIDLSSQFFISATEGIYAGRGQKITSFGSLQISAKGLGFTTVEIGDVNVLGDLVIESRGRLGGELTLLGHLGEIIHGVDNEGDRNGTGYDEQGAELIASGDITLRGTLTEDSAGALLGANSVLLANDVGASTILGLTIVEFPGGVSLANFMGNQPGTGGMAYAYDLTLGSFLPPADANLATAFVDEDILNLRDDAPYLAQQQVLIELSVAPTLVSDEVVRDGAASGLERFDKNAAGALTLDRLSPRSVERLTEAYIGLFGQRNAEDGSRPGIEGIAQTLANGNEDEIDVLMSQIGLVLDRIALLELSPMEIQQAQSALLEMIRPESMDSAQFRSQWAKN